MEFIGFIFVQLFLAVSAAAVGAICAIVVLRATRKVQRRRRLAAVVAFLFPIMVTFYLEAGVIGYGIARYTLGKDSFLNGFYHYPLVNGYRLVIFDKMPEMATIQHGPNDAAPVDVSEVRRLQVSGNLIIVEAHKGENATDWGRDKVANRYLVIDSETSKQTEFSSAEELRHDMDNRGVHLQLEETQEILIRVSKPGIFGWVLFALLATPALIAAVWLLRMLQQLRRGVAASPAANVI